MPEKLYQKRKYARLKPEGDKLCQDYARFGRNYARIMRSSIIHASITSLMPLHSESNIIMHQDAFETSLETYTNFDS